ncbi:hypothetical protein [Hafnia paralvei]|uniref:hypothetical protein n=1 Tax=Hafnia paralvei TaxID=546367 RepID=UPI000BB54621|nr:hypothetical protein [Hafnia paralvei]PNK67781.1 hypothetical protein A6J69_012360 [Hafnia paralvei]
MTSREQFEAQIRLHADENEIEERLATANGGLNYAHPETDVAWIWWQASREAVEIELPTRVDCCNVPFAAHSWNACLEESEKRIRAAGIKVKGE